VSELNGAGAADLGAIRARQLEKDATPPYDPGTPEFVLQVGRRLVDGEPSFSGAIDQVARQLDVDGWAIECVRSSTVLGVDPQQDAALFQVVVQVRPKKTG
jgi:hypothetical protein